MGDLGGIQSDLAQLVRLVIAEQYDDVRLYVARLVRKYRKLCLLYPSSLIFIYEINRKSLHKACVRLPHQNKRCLKPCLWTRSQGLPCLKHQMKRL